ncbi:hypothetical protein [Streptomyces chryseus]
MRVARRGGLRSLGGVLLVVAVSAVGCGESGQDRLVVQGKAPARPYGGVLWVPQKNVGDDTAEGRASGSGAAGRALECEGGHTGGGSGSWSEGDGGATPEEGLRAYFDIEQPEVPEYGYRVERQERDRVLYSFDVKGKTKIAVVVAKDRPGRPGWGPETSASCDPAELPADYTDTKDYEVWNDEQGNRVPVSKVSSSAGSAHCAWQKAHFLELGTGAKRELYARDPDNVLPSGMLTSAYDADAAMPSGARDTGYRLDGQELWRAADTSKVYVRTPEGVEAWPAVEQGMGCL